MMFKLTLLLCAGLFSAMQIGGVDRGQRRFGLIEKPTEVLAQVIKIETAKEKTSSTSADTSLTKIAFAPDAPLMVAPFVTETMLAPSAPEPALGMVMVVNSTSVNVRSGPGKEYEVIERLGRGDTVLVVTKDDDADGWSLIRIEGDGIEGYIASRLLTE